MSFDCVAVGPPTPVVTWLKGDDSVIATDRVTIGDDGRLSIRDVTDADAGKYTCQAENVMGSAQSSVEVSRPGTVVTIICNCS